MKNLPLPPALFYSFLWITIYSASSSAANDVITVTTITDQPWLKIKKENPSSNEDFEGYIPELLKLVAKKINADYSLKLVGDKKYGQYDNSTKTWNGMIGEILNGRADLAAAALTMSKERESAVDFSVPIMTFDSAILLLKTNDGRHEKITSCADLVNQPDMTFGLIRGGLTESIFNQLQEEPYKRMALKMKQDATLSVDNTADGVAKVRRSQGKYALILEGPTAEFVADTEPCDLHYVKLNLERRSYAWGMKKNFHLKEQINTALSDIKKSGELDAIDRKWRKLNACSSSSVLRFQFSLGQFLGALSLLIAVFHSV